MKILGILFGILFLFSVKSYGTAQTPDYLIIEKDTLMLHSNPLDNYFKINPISEGLITSISSANWRGYIAYFKFIDNKLVVENIYKENYNDTEENYSLVSIYKDIFGINPNFECNFYSGLLVCPQGEVLEYVHMGYSSIYERYKLFEINFGVNIKSKECSGQEFLRFKVDYYKYYKTTDDYKIKVEEFKKMFIETNIEVEKAIENTESSNKKQKKKENIYLKQKEAEYKLDKEIDNFMFIFLDDYIKTIEIPKN